MDHEDTLCHYGRKGMKWGKHIYAKDKTANGTIDDTIDDIQELLTKVNEKTEEAIDILDDKSKVVAGKITGAMEKTNEKLAPMVDRLKELNTEIPERIEDAGKNIQKKILEAPEKIESILQRADEKLDSMKDELVTNIQTTKNSVTPPRTGKEILDEAKSNIQNRKDQFAAKKEERLQKMKEVLSALEKVNSYMDNKKEEKPVYKPPLPAHKLNHSELDEICDDICELADSSDTLAHLDPDLIDEIDDILAHDGILGMKWGQRRYQNSDGTYTDEGLERKRAARQALMDSKAEYRMLKKQNRQEEKNAQMREQIALKKARTDQADEYAKQQVEAENRRKMEAKENEFKRKEAEKQTKWKEEQDREAAERKRKELEAEARRKQAEIDAEKRKKDKEAEKALEEQAKENKRAFKKALKKGEKMTTQQKSARDIYERRETMTAKDLEDAIKWIQKEEELRKLMKKDDGYGKELAKRVLKQTANTLIPAAATAVGAYYTKQLLTNVFGEDVAKGFNVKQEKKDDKKKD